MQTTFKRGFAVEGKRNRAAAGRCSEVKRILFVVRWRIKSIVYAD